MFTSLHAAKKSGVIAFDWSDTCVIVSGLDWNNEPTFYGVCLVAPNFDKTDTERSLAIAFGVLADPAPWVADEL